MMMMMMVHNHLPNSIDSYDASDPEQQLRTGTMAALQPQLLLTYRLRLNDSWQMMMMMMMMMMMQ
jgi:hypothetical protein